jgi:hypothetical protein
MNECLRLLDEAKECPNDEILVQQVRLQLIVEKRALGTFHDGAIESTENMGDPPSFYLERLHTQLQDIKTKILAQPQTNGKLFCAKRSMNSTYVIIEVVFLHLYSLELETALSPAFFHTNQLTLQQRKYRNAGLESINSWFEVFFTIPPAAYIGFPFSIFSQLLRCVVSLYRLTTLEDLSGNEKSNCKAMDPLLVLDRVINNLEQVHILAGLENSDSSELDEFSRSAQMLRSIRSGWEAKLGSSEPSTLLPPQNFNDSFPADALGVEVFDSDWFMDLFLSPNC